MVTLHPISTPNEIPHNNNNIYSSSSSSSSPTSSSPTSPLLPHTPPSEITKMPLYYPLLQPNILFFQYYPPPYFHYYYYNPNPNPNPNPVWFHPGQVVPPPPAYLNTQNTPGDVSVAVGPTTIGPRSGNKRVGFGFRGKKVWRPKENNIINDNNMDDKNNNNNKNNDKNCEGMNKKKKKKLGNPNCKTITMTAELAICTTIMLRNIPNTLRRKDLMELLDRHCREQNQKEDNNDQSFESQYDFVYLPFDFLRGQNLGYAFINFTTVKGASTLYTCWNNKGWICCPKIRAITPAKLQGLVQCRRHFESSVFKCESEEFLPLEFSPPRNGFNGDPCNAKTIGKWVCNGDPSRKRPSDIFWWAKTVHPPRLSRNSARG